MPTQETFSHSPVASIPTLFQADYGLNVSDALPLLPDLSGDLGEFNQQQLELVKEMLQAGPQVGRQLAQRLTEHRLLLMSRVAEECGIAPLIREGGAALVATGSLTSGQLGPGSDLDSDLYVGPTDYVPEGEDNRITAFQDALRKIGLDWTIVQWSPGSIEQELGSGRIDALGRFFNTQLVTGSREIYQERLQEFVEVVRSRPKQILELINNTIDLQHSSVPVPFSPSALTPNLKNSPGALRDLNSIQQLCQVAVLCGREKDLREIFSEEDLAFRAAANSFIVGLRAALHFSQSGGQKAEEASNVLSEDLKLPVAALTGRDVKNADQALTQMMAQYYAYARGVWRLLDRVRTNLCWPGQATVPVKFAERVAAARGELEASRGETSSDIDRIVASVRVFGALPWRNVIRNASDYDRLMLREGKELLIEVERGLPSSDSIGYRSVEVGRELQELLGRRGYVGFRLRQMDEVGLLGKVFPSYETIRGLGISGSHHRVTLDEHALSGLESIDAVYRQEFRELDLYAGRIQAIKHPEAVYLAHLYHDVERSSVDIVTKKPELSAMLAAADLTRLGFDKDVVEKVSTLVRHHLELTELSQVDYHRADERVDRLIEGVGNRETLNSLLVLSFGDQFSINPTDPVKRQRLIDAYRWVYRKMSGNGDGARDLSIVADMVTQTLSGQASEISAEKVYQHLGMLDSPYRDNQVRVIGEHVRMVEELVNTPKEGDVPRVIATWIPDERYRLSSEAGNVSGGLARLLVVADDHPGLFQIVTGVVAGRSIGVDEASIHTRADGIACDVFLVQPKSGHKEEDLENIRQRILEVIHAPRDIQVRSLMQKPEMRPATPGIVGNQYLDVVPRVEGDNLVINVTGVDFVGLAAEVGRILADRELNIISAKLKTGPSRVENIFTVRCPKGMPFTDDRIEELVTACRWLYTEEG